MPEDDSTHPLEVGADVVPIADMPVAVVVKAVGRLLDKPKRPPQEGLVQAMAGRNGAIKPITEDIVPDDVDLSRFDDTLKQTAR